MTTYRAAYWISDDGQAEVRLTGEADAHLDDDALLAKARDEAIREDVSLETGRLVVGEWTEGGE